MELCRRVPRAESADMQGRNAAMTTLHEILSRTDERLNLKNMGLCTLVVLVLVTVAFGILNFRSIFPQTQEKAPQSVEVEKVDNI